MNADDPKPDAKPDAKPAEPKPDAEQNLAVQLLKLVAPAEAGEQAAARS